MEALFDQLFGRLFEGHFFAILVPKGSQKSSQGSLFKAILGHFLAPLGKVKIQLPSARELSSEGFRGSQTGPFFIFFLISVPGPPPVASQSIFLEFCVETGPIWAPFGRSVWLIFGVQKNTKNQDLPSKPTSARFSSPGALKELLG